MTETPTPDEIARWADLAERATPLAEFPGYAVSREGTVWSLSSNWRGYGARPLVPVVDDQGYRRVRLVSTDGRRIRRSVHGLVARIFIGPPPGVPDAQVCHVNGNPADNRVENLRWGTAADNAADRARHGTTAIGERNGCARLSNAQVWRIRELSEAGHSQRTIATAVGVSQTTVGKILREEHWGHVR